MVWKLYKNVCYVNGTISMKEFGVLNAEDERIIDPGTIEEIAEFLRYQAVNVYTREEKIHLATISRGEETFEITRNEANKVIVVMRCRPDKKSLEKIAEIVSQEVKSRLEIPLVLPSSSF